jgi:thiol-disulfide isomerase/thioredoxin
MLQAIASGPFVFSVPSLLVFGSVAAGYAVGAWLDRRRDAGIARKLMSALLVALVAARATYVVEWLDAYARHPLDMLDIRDGGWNMPLGLLIAVIYVMAVTRRRGRATSSSGPRPVLLAIGVAMVTYLAGSAAARLFGPPVGQDITSSIALSTLDGRALRLSQFKGLPTVVNLWATWCGPCRRELPLLIEAQASHPEIHFVFANQGEDVDRVSRYLAASGFDATNVVLDTGSELARASDAQGWPTTLYLNRSGQLVATDTGALTATRLSQRLAELRAGRTD